MINILSGFSQDEDRVKVIQAMTMLTGVCMNLTTFLPMMFSWLSTGILEIASRALSILTVISNVALYDGLSIHGKNLLAPV